MAKFASVLGALLLVFLVVSRAAEASPSDVTVAQSCTGGKVDVTFSWRGNAASALEQWLDVSNLDNGWVQGTYQAAGPLSSTTNSYLWKGFGSGGRYFVRVNQKQSNQSWQGTPTFSFITSCDVGVTQPAVRPPYIPPRLDDYYPLFPAEPTCVTAHVSGYWDAKARCGFSPLFLFDVRVTPPKRTDAYSVEVRVYAPGEITYARKSRVPLGDFELKFSYPFDFVLAPDPVPGTYRIEVRVDGIDTIAKGTVFVE